MAYVGTCIAEYICKIVKALSTNKKYDPVSNPYDVAPVLIQTWHVISAIGVGFVIKKLCSEVKSCETTTTITPYILLL